MGTYSVWLWWDMLRWLAIPSVIVKLLLAVPLREWLPGMSPQPAVPTTSSRHQQLPGSSQAQVPARHAYDSRS